jgi:very-short-patch-repair endonuclease
MIGNKNCVGRKNSPEAIEKTRQAHLGKSLSPEHREKIRQAALGRHRSLESIEKQRQTMFGRKHSPERRKNISQGQLGNKRSPEFREKMREARLRRHFPTKMTNIERLLRDEFRKRRLHFEMHKTMFGRFQPDFVFESARLIVQADGDYWHSRPDKKASDSAFNKAADDGGWSVWRFGGREIEMHAAACGRAVARFVRDH